MKASFKILLLTLSLNIFICNKANAIFILADEVLNPPLDIERIKESVGRLKSTWHRKDRGTFFFTSNDGYLMTNLHIIDRCLKRNNLIDKKNSSQSDFHQFNRVLTPLEKIICEELTFDPETEGTFWGKGELIFLGRGFGFVDSERIDELNETEFDQFLNFSEDFAVLKVRTNKPVPCLPIRRKPVETGESQLHRRLFSFGFPTITKRNNGFDSNGRSLYASFGFEITSIEEDISLQMRSLSEKSWNRQKRLTSQERFLLTNLESARSSSGSPILSEDGLAEAILYGGTIGPSDTTNFIATTMGIKTSHIFERIKKVSSTLAEQVFDCHPIH